MTQSTSLNFVFSGVWRSGCICRLSLLCGTVAYSLYFALKGDDDMSLKTFFTTTSIKVKIIIACAVIAAAGGIISAAIDGINCVDAIVEKRKLLEL